MTAEELIAALAELDAFNARPPPTPEECLKVALEVGPPGFTQKHKEPPCES